MKNVRGYADLGTIFDEIFDAAQDFRDEFQRSFTGFSGRPFHTDGFKSCFDETVDYYPNYSYPPMNVCMTGDRSLVFEFALAGFDEKNISLSFQGDYMVFSALIEESRTGEEDSVLSQELHYLKRRLKLKDIEKQKYYVPLDKYAQDKVKAVFKNGILRVTVPPKAEPDQNDGIRIEIVKEGN